MPIHTLKPGYYGKGSVYVESTSKPGETPPRRTAITADRLITQPFEGIDTLPDIISYAARTHGTANGMGWRDIVRIHEEQKEVKKFVGGKEVTEMKTWKYFELSDYKYLSFVEVETAVTEVARGLVHLGVGKDDVFNVYSATCVNWQLMSLGCAWISTAIATAYDTLGVPGLTHSLNEPNCIGLFTNGDLLPTLAEVLPNTPSIKYIVYDGEPKSDLLDKLRATRSDITVLHITDLRSLGAAQPLSTLTARKPTPSSVSCIMYTSGTTGAPKGVVLTHGNLIASVGAVYYLLGHHFLPGDTFLAYLPLAHVLEYIVELCLYFSGMTLGYGRVKTLTDASVRGEGCKGDIRAFGPSIMVGVPAVWETIRKGILSKVNAGGTIKKGVFSGALVVKKAGVPGLSQFVDSAVFATVRQATGGRLRIALSGGAALSRETQEFLTTALVTMLQGYGMTESCGMCAILPPELLQPDCVGLPMPSIEVKLLDVPEAGYLTSSDIPQGEVCIRGPSVTKGYYKRPDLNEDPEIFTKDGWLRTGDVGQWNRDGTLSLVDRIKNLVKLQGGEYIALERLESTYKSCNFVGNICVHASVDAKQPIAIIIPHEPNLRLALQSKSILPPSSQLADKSSQLADLCEDERVRELVLKECNAVGKKAGFKSLEMLQAVVLTAEEWTPESGLVTAAQKVQRKKVAEKYEREIKEAYKNQ
ncbi:hypothetical protein PLICRDRAFT_40448 [Plicaturopsis crispa FD-325 SS-3]|nr:hypothetical protein PLICRDRAFT_40448 [Plicaturopsis crispa FD-325 SS-3]